MDPLGIMIRNLLNICIGLKKSPGFAIEDGSLRIGEVDSTCLRIDLRLLGDLWVWLLLPLEQPVIIQKTLFSIDDGSHISAFHQLFDEPLDDWETSVVI